MAFSALTQYDVNDAETNKQWAKKLHYGVMQRTVVYNPAYGFVSSKSSSMVQEFDELSKSYGDRIRVTLLQQLKGRGVIGTANLAGREEGQQTDTFDFFIDKQRHGTGTAGEMTDQRVSWDTMDEQKEMLADWWSARYECGAATHLCGFTAPGTTTYLNPGGDQIDGTDLAYTGLNAPQDPQAAGDTNHLLRTDPAAANDQALGANDEIDSDDLERLVVKAKRIPFPIRQLKAKGGVQYVCFLSELQVRDLKATSSNWYALMSNAITGGRVDDNPIFTGALGMVSGTLFKEWHWISPGINSGTGIAAPDTRRAVFAGAQAVCLAHGRGYGGGKNKMKWSHESEDHGDKYYAGAGAIWGNAATVYNSEFFGHIVMTSFSPDAI